MFRDDKQRGLCCLILCNRVHLEGVWEVDGDNIPRPTGYAVKILDGEMAAITSERLMVRVAFDFWNGYGHTTIGECLAVFDSDNLSAVAQLMRALASGPTDIDAWIREWGS